MKALSFVTFILFLGCDPFNNRATDLDFKPIERGIRQTAKTIDFNDIRNRVIVPYCLDCHGNYLNYSTVYSQRNKILSTIISGRMPKDKAKLSKDLIRLVQDWIDTGAVRDDQTEGGSEPTNVPKDLSPKMKELYKKHSKFIPELDQEKPLKLSKEGAPFTYTFEGGREAELQYSISKTRKALVRMDLVENTCGQLKPQACVYVAHLSNHLVRLNWTKHNDQSRIGKALELNDAFEGEEPSYKKIEIETYLSAFNDLVFPKLDQGLKDYIVCEDWSWMPQQNQPVMSWSVERMFTNSESGMDDNQVIGALYDMNFKKHDKYSYQVVNPKFLETKFNRMAVAPYIGEAGSFWYEASGMQCMVGFKFDFFSAVTSIQNGGEQESFSTYHGGQDSIFDQKDPNSTIYYELKDLAEEGVDVR